jgi:hypothetical protein
MRSLRPWGTQSGRKTCVHNPSTISEAPFEARIRQHTSAYVSKTCVHALSPRRLCNGGGAAVGQQAYVSIRQHTSAYVSIRQHTSAYVSIRTFAIEADAAVGQQAYVSTRQHTSAYVRIEKEADAAVRRRHHCAHTLTRRRKCQHTSAYAPLQ